MTQWKEDREEEWPGQYPVPAHFWQVQPICHSLRGADRLQRLVLSDDTETPIFLRGEACRACGVILACPRSLEH